MEILASADMNEAIHSPRWLVIFELHLECERIINLFQRQPRSQLERQMVYWSWRTLEALPDLEDEGEWALDVEIPPFFKESDVSSKLYMSKIIILMIKKNKFNINIPFPFFLACVFS